MGIVPIPGSIPRVIYIPGKELEYVLVEKLILEYADMIFNDGIVDKAIVRVTRNAKLIDYLTTAAENGKEVTVLMELRARFDEQNNIDWSETLEEAGCNVIYGFENFKVHSKICLITRKDVSDIQYITQVGTGNYDKLLVAPVNMKKRILKFIDEEIAKGSDGRIILKMNSLTDRKLMDKLKEASCAGVKINMIIRGICCLVPGIKNKTENIEVHSIVGRFLEHSRVYCFGYGDNMKMYIASADYMTRNMDKRVEVGCPIYDEKIKERILEMLYKMLNDNVKGRIIQSNGEYRKIKQQDNEVLREDNIEVIEKNINSQKCFIEEA